MLDDMIELFKVLCKSKKHSVLVKFSYVSFEMIEGSVSYGVEFFMHR